MKTAGREVELALAATHGIVAGMDEVGRGALAGPVAVGVALVDAADRPVPAGLTDSKSMTAHRRAAMVPLASEWAIDSAVGLASPAEIDRWGIIVGLRLAGMRALEQVISRGHMPGIVLLDGSHDWLSTPEDLMSAVEEGPRLPQIPRIEVVTRVKADLDCAVVSAASVLAKEHRDGLMARLEDPGYGWAKNKGYSAPAHIAGLEKLGACDQHRRSWNLPLRIGVPRALDE
ncbi:ribonuclease HII [Schaalia vaccimaxillae]|uniref:ribonuclease HII n=1 Tax=Schaalia vaccimaxillae TaxID=183916 RepID=UPI0003B5F49A|nr:ribonuclease HII [Schaalia vaccimaxillae]